MRPILATVSRSLTFLLPILAAAGTSLLPVPLFGYTLSGFRLLVLPVLILALIRHPSLPVIQSDLPTKFAGVLVLWLLVGLASLLWTTDRNLGIAELLSIAAGGSVAYSLGVFQKVDPRTLDFLRRGWIFALCCMYVIVAWELMTDRHLEGSYVMRNQMIYGDGFSFGVQGTLDNPNNLAAFAVFSAPFVIWSMLLSQKAVAAIGSGALLLSIGALAVLTGARLSLLTFTLQVVIFCVQSGPRRGRVRLVGALALAVITGALLVMTTTLAKLSDLADQFTGSDGTPIRKNLFLNGIDFFVRSCGAGIGAGGYTGTMQQGAGRYPTSNSVATIVNAHSGFIEVSQYGLLVLIAVLGIFLITAHSLWRGRTVALNEHRNSLSLSTQVGLVAILSLMILSFEGSMFLTETVNWMFIASVLVLGSQAESSELR